MSWNPDKRNLSSPLYLSIASLLEYNILNGYLKPHTKLPPQRELADYLDINLSSITRAFKIYEMKNLIYAITGSGTFVSPNAGNTIFIADNDTNKNLVHRYKGRNSKKSIILSIQEIDFLLFYDLLNVFLKCWLYPSPILRKDLEKYITPEFY
ncbi:winged helix-turn-helix transcriptional regulator [Brevibacillus sp. 7WMA2]|nr:winged helix-turn-helix transcriptional regulator [Brevibacillus sp. 7WMA2]